MSVQHYLLVYDRAAGALVDEQVFEDRRAALSARLDEERRYREHGDNIEIVTIGAASREDLMRTHARYFLSLAELAALGIRSA